MAITDDGFKRAIVAHLKSKSPEDRWHGNRMGDYLDLPRWKITDYQEHMDMNTGEEYNTRTFGLSGASEDGRQSGKMLVTTTADDTKFHAIVPLVPRGKLTAAQHDFVALARGEAQWLMDNPKPESTHPEFGSW